MQLGTLSSSAPKATWFERWAAPIENRPYYAQRLLFAATFVGLFRWLEEFAYTANNFYGLDHALHLIAWYLLIYIGITAATAVATGIEWRKVSHIVSYAIYIGILPPILDVVVHGPRGFSYYYMFEFRPLLNPPDFPVGEIAVLWLSIALAGIYGLARTRSILRGIAASLGVYAVFVLVGFVLPLLARDFVFPLFLATWSGPKSLGMNVADVHVFIAAALIIYAGLRWRDFKHSWTRVNHALPWFFTVLLGAACANGITDSTVYVAALVLLMHTLIVASNDYYDRAEDASAGRAGGIDHNDVLIFNAAIVLMGLALAQVRPVLGVLALLYFFVTLAYHHDSTRLKQICPINYKTEGVVGLLAFLIGLFADSNFKASGLQLFLAFLVFGGFSVVSTFKDYKDIDADQKHRIRTIYVVLRERGWSLSRSHRVVTGLVTFALLPPVVALPIFFGAAALVYSLALLALAAAATWQLATAAPRAAVARTLWLVSLYLGILALAVDGFRGA